MAETDPSKQQVPASRSVSRRRTRLSLVWFIPIVAAVAGVWVAVTRILGQGPEISIILKTAEGLEAGKTKIHYSGVDVGTVSTIRLSEDHMRVVAKAQMAPDTNDFLVKDTQFWVVRPRISGANVTGLGTLISGAYIGMEIGKSKDHEREFVALDTPPVVTGDVPGRFYVLQAGDLGSLDIGTPVYFRRLQVGQIASYHLDDKGQMFNVKIFVDAPYDQFVTPSTRFWQASGVDVSLSAAGLSVQTQSLLSILIGGVAFETPADAPEQPAAAENAVYTLFVNRTDAFRLPARDPQTFVLNFKESVRGLEPGAPVEFRGIPLGDVADIGAELDYKTFEFTAPVTIHLDAERLGVRVEDAPVGVERNQARREFIDSLVAHGVRAQLQTASLLTGARFVAFDFFPDAPPASINWAEKPVELPTRPGQLQAIEASVVSIIRKLDQVPIQQIGADLQKALAELDRTLVSARGTIDNTNTLVGNADRMIQPSSGLGVELGNTLQEVQRAARGVRVLADYLERHPEALIRGKTEENK